MIVGIAIACASNFALGDFDKSFNDLYNQINIVDLATVGIIVLLGLALGLYLVFRPAPEPLNRNRSGVPGYLTNEDGTLTP